MKQHSNPKACSLLIEGEFIDQLSHLSASAIGNDRQAGEPGDVATLGDDSASDLPSSRTVAVTLFEIINDGTNPRTEEHADWIRIGAALHHSTGGDQIGCDLFLAWSRQHPKFNRTKTLAAWNSFKSRSMMGERHD